MAERGGARWVALIGPELEENLSLRYLSAALMRAGYRTEILAFNSSDDVMRIVERLVAETPAPLLVGISLAFQWRAVETLALVMALRESGYAGHVTAGGHFATFAADEILSDFAELDSVCRQEAEDTIVELCRCLERGETPAAVLGVSFRDQESVRHNALRGLPDITSLPWPDRRGAPAEVFGHGIAPLVGSRGCYANCSFCCIAAWHEHALPGKRWRARDVDELADEMAWLHRERGTEIFVFHDDNFFLPGAGRNRERFSRLADALAARGVERFATIVKARPNDLKPDVVEVLQERLRCLRMYVGVETDSEQGLVTLGRWASRAHNAEAIALLRERQLFACFNVLLFDPDTTFESLGDNLDFLSATSDFPFNFGRVELYAGTPLLARMRGEQRCKGDYLQWSYRMREPAMERVFRVSNTVFHARNFAEDALANAMMGVRFDIETCAHFHPEVFDDDWRRRGIKLSESLGAHSVEVLRRIVNAVCTAPAGDDGVLAEGLKREVAMVDRRLRQGAVALVSEIHARVGRGLPVTALDDAGTTPLMDGTGAQQS